ncbi:hypothetical protein G6F42_022797 [Rhizopus arrhizus]|nr:hypothetical protein G6F42_022797 [Rhizopus arrhizus]
MSYSDINWAQRSRYNDQARSSHSRISLLSTPTEEPSFVRNATATATHSHLNKTLTKLIDRFDISPRNASLGDIQRQKDRLVDKFSRILSTQTEPSIVENENDIANALHTQRTLKKNLKTLKKRIVLDIYTTNWHPGKYWKRNGPFSIYYHSQVIYLPAAVDPIYLHWTALVRRSVDYKTSTMRQQQQQQSTCSHGFPDPTICIPTIHRGIYAVD